MGKLNKQTQEIKRESSKYNYWTKKRRKME